MALTFKQSQEVLKILASVSTKEHAEQIIKRNSEALESGYSQTPCPHCLFTSRARFHCKNCLWTYAFNKVSKISLGAFEGAPCCNVDFLEAFDGIPSGVKLAASHLNCNNSRTVTRLWLRAHIRWASDTKNWGTKKAPKKYRREVNK